MTDAPQLVRPRPLQPDVVVNGETISAAAIAAEAQNHPAPPGKPGAAWSAAARALAVHALLLQEARRLGLAPAPRALGAGRRETDDEALIRAVIEPRVAPAPPERGRLPRDTRAPPRPVPRAHPLRRGAYPAARGA